MCCTWCEINYVLAIPDVMCVCVRAAVPGVSWCTSNDWSVAHCTMSCATPTCLPQVTCHSSAATARLTQLTLWHWHHDTDSDTVTVTLTRPLFCALCSESLHQSVRLTQLTLWHCHWQWHCHHDTDSDTDTSHVLWLRCHCQVNSAHSVTLTPWHWQYTVTVSLTQVACCGFAATARLTQLTLWHWHWHCHCDTDTPAVLCTVFWVTTSVSQSTFYTWNLPSYLNTTEQLCRR